MLKKPRFAVQIPEVIGGDIDQDEEWCWVEIGGRLRRLRLHDYHEIYSVPGLYEDIFYNRLECQSPQVVCTELIREVRKEGWQPEDLVVLDIGAGNGMMGDELKDEGAQRVDGIDIIEEAAEAARRDRPGVYQNYFVADLANLSETNYHRLKAAGYNCLTTVAALGFNDIPPRAFAAGYNLVATPGWIAFNIKDAFLHQEDPTGFSRLIRQMIDSGVLSLRSQRHYRHRLSVAGKGIYYLAVVGVKHGDIPREWIEQLP